MTSAAETPPPPSSFDLPRLEFKALRLMPTGWAEGWGLGPSPARRNWMDEEPRAYQCLPLVIANQWGWQVLCPTEVRVTWDGTPRLAGLRIEVDPQYLPAIKSQFGAGIVTFSPPWLFRTPPGWDLYLKGPSNRWKPNCHPLEGIIETWWLNYTFTINWKLIEPGTVVFARGESLGQLVPVPHATFEGSTALEAPIGQLEPRGGPRAHGVADGAGSSSTRRSTSITSTARPRASRITCTRSACRNQSIRREGWTGNLPERRPIWYLGIRSSSTLGNEEVIDVSDHESPGNRPAQHPGAYPPGGRDLGQHRRDPR